MSDQDNIYDLIIVGSGAGGLSAAIYASRSNLKTAVFEKKQVGGQISTSGEIVNYPGFESESGLGLMEKFRDHAVHFGTNYIKETVKEVIDEDNLKKIITNKNTYYAKSVILNLGNLPRVLGLPGEKELTGLGVSYCATCDAEFYRNQVVYILGSGNQAIEESQMIAKFASKVVIIALNNPGELDCNKFAAQAVFDNPKISFIWNSTVAAINGKDSVESVDIKNIKTGKIDNYQADGIFMFVGTVPQTKIVENLVETNKAGFIIVSEKMETSVPGIFAIGDCVQKWLRQVITAAADGAIAAVAAERYIEEIYNFNEYVIKGKLPSIMAFWKPPYLEKEMLIVEQLEKYITEHKYEINFVREDVSLRSVVFRKLKLHNTPSFAYYKDGKLVKLIDEKEYNLEDLINNLLK